MDIKIGLDIAWLSSKRVVDKMVLVTEDHDFIPAMKFARREGVTVAIVALGGEPKPAFKEHADRICSLDLRSLLGEPARRPSSRSSAPPPDSP